MQEVGSDARQAGLWKRTAEQCDQDVDRAAQRATMLGGSSDRKAKFMRLMGAGAALRKKGVIEGPGGPAKECQ